MRNFVSFLTICFASFSLSANCRTSAQDQTLNLTKRSYEKVEGQSNQFKIKLASEKWHAKESAIIVCDMWDLHHCKNAVLRGTEMAPRMNKVLIEARSKGATIIHAPSSCMKFYSNHHARKRAINTSKAKNMPQGIGDWCNQIAPEKEGTYPIDQSDGGEDDDLQEHAQWAKKLESMGRNPRAPWKSQMKTLEIKEQDYISDNGKEIWSILHHKKIDNVILLGVHTNMCVLGRPFGLRQMSKNGKNVVLMRDMTDTMYNPKRWPYVSHYQGTDLIVQHIEKFVCPTITSDQIIGDKPFRFKKDIRKKALVVIAEELYETRETLPKFAAEILKGDLGFDVQILQSKKSANVIPNLQSELKNADVVLLSVRRRALPKKDLDSFRKYLRSGKPLVAIRTSSHAFDTRGKHTEGHAEWAAFDTEILGGDYSGHFAHEKVADVSANKNSKHPILINLPTQFKSKSLYQYSSLEKTAKLLLSGKIEGEKSQPVAWVNEVNNGRIFYTSLGTKSDFQNPAFVKLLENGVRWTTGMKIGKAP